MSIAVTDGVDGLANPDWVLRAARSGSSIGTGRTVRDDGRGHDALRRATLERVLAVKVLDAHLRNRVQLMQRDPTDLSELSPADAALLIRAMAAAGHADGGLQDAERRRLVGYAATSRLDAAERRAVLAEIEHPPSIEGLIRQIATAPLAERFYAVSVAVIRRDAPVCRAYLTYLALRLDLSNDVVLRLNREVDPRR